MAAIVVSYHLACLRTVELMFPFSSSVNEICHDMELRKSTFHVGLEYGVPVN